MTGYDDDLRLAHVLADAVERSALETFGSLDQEVELGPEGSVRTSTGSRLEELLRHQLQRTRPRDRVEGRYLEPTGHSDRTWMIDALDGTANYVRGVPAWATLISLVVGGEPVLGLVAAPSLSRRWWAGAGSGAWTGRMLARATRIEVSTTSRLAHASVSTDDVASWVNGGVGQGFVRLAGESWRTRAYGDFWSHALLAEGAVDVTLASRADILQLATLLPLLREAGARVSDPWGADALLPQLGPGGPVVATNGHLHDEVLSTLTGIHATIIPGAQG